MTNDQSGPMGGRTPVELIAAELQSLPLVGRWASGAGVCAGVIGAIAGLVVGLVVHPATAWFAVIELGLPAAIVGGAAGTVAALAVLAVHRIRRRP